MNLDKMPANSRLHNTKQASDYLHDTYGIRRAPATLNKLRVVGGGPPFRRIGTKSIAYDEPSLDRWALDLIGKPLRSTSESA